MGLWMDRTAPAALATALVAIFLQGCATGVPVGSATGAAAVPKGDPPGRPVPPPLLALDRLPATPTADAVSKVMPVLADTAVDPAEEAASPGVEFERGGASWYGSRFQGRRTASGERFDTADFTAAHRTLPFGTLVCVRNLTNSRAVLVRVNDRGPSSRRRVIDISQAAADQLAMVGMGVQTVTLSRPVSGQERCE